jgi:hypothetical protein
MTNIPVRTAFFFASTWILSAAAPTVWVFDSLTRVAPTAAAGTQTQMTIYAGRGEYQSFQIGIQAPSGGLTTVNVTASALTGPGGATIPASNLILFREQYVTIASNQTSDGSADGNPCTECPLGAGTYADGLIPFVDPDTGLPPTGTATITAVPFALTAGQNQPIWVDILVPTTAAPGAYTGTLTITSDQGQSQVSLTLNVWNFTMPFSPTLKSTFEVWNNAHKPSTDRELMRNRLMPDQVNNAAEAQTLVTDFGLGATGIPWFSGADYGDCSTNQASPTVAQAASAAAPYQQLGLLVYDFSFDEIDACTNLYPTIIQWAQNLHQAGVDQLITMAPVEALFNDGLGTGRSAVDIWAMEPDVYVTAQSQNPPMATAALAKGNQVWAYQTLIQDDYSPKWLIDFAPIGMRTMAGFLSQSLNFTGLLYWKVDGWLSGDTATSWTDVFYKESGNTYPGEAILVYPADPLGMPGKVAPSMRLKQLRDGEQDFEYIQMLKNLGQGSYALQVAASVASSYMNWSQTPATLQAARLTLGEALNTLSGGAPQVLMSANPASLTFTATVNGAASPSSQNVAVSASNGSSMSFSVAPQANGGAWLNTTTAQGATPASVGISASATGLAAGTYTGSVTVTASGVSNSPLAVPVTLTVTAAPAVPAGTTLSASPTSLSFSATAGGSAPAAETLSITTASGSLTVAAAASTQTGGNWLTVSSGGKSASSAKAQKLSVSVNGSGLAAGTYNGSITVTASGATNNPLTVAVSFTVAAPPVVTVSASPTAVSLSATAGEGNVHATVAISASNGGKVKFTVSSSTVSGGDWLSVAQSGATPDSLKVTANASSLAAGTYTGSVTITSSDGSLTLPVTFTVTAKSSTGRSAEVWRSRPRPDESAF